MLVDSVSKGHTARCVAKELDSVDMAALMCVRRVR
jgi:hypothetical protein